MKKSFIFLILILLFTACNVATIVTDAKTELGNNFTQRGGGIKESLLHFWKLEEGVGQIRYDSQGNLDFQDINSFNIPNIAGVSGNALTGSGWGVGSGPALYSSQSFSFNTNGNLAISIWIKMTAVPAADNVIFDSGNFRIFITTARDFRVSFDSGATSLIFSAIVPNDNTWHHYVVNVDFKGASFAYLFQDNTQVGSTTTTGVTVNDPTSSNNAMMSYNSGTGEVFELQVDSFGIWGRTLGTHEVDNLYNLNSGLD